LPFGATPPPFEHWVVFALSGIINGTAHYLTIKALHLASAATVAPLRYLSLVWAGVIGFLVWGDVPSGWTIVGAILVSGAGLYTAHRELRRLRN
jgi:drug/metabolite transporter (DMT)-like permease